MLILIFMGRCILSSCVQSLYIYTLEYYPTRIRALGLGSCSSFSRIGALTSPFAAQLLFKAAPHVCLSIFAIVSLVAGIATLMLPIETKGRMIEVNKII